MTADLPKAKPEKQPTAKAKRPPGLAHGRWLGDFPRLSAAEKALVAACALGEVWAPKGWDGKRPEAATDANTIRAELIRFLVLGGDAEHSVHDEGVMLGGAWVDDVLNLHQVQAHMRLDMRYCHFAETPSFMNASLPELSLSGCFCPGLQGDRLTVTGSLFLNDGFHSTGEVRLLGARIGSNLQCNGGRFKNAKANAEGNKKGSALVADSLSVKGSVFLDDGFHGMGAVRLLGAQIGGDLYCGGGKFENIDGIAFNLQSVTVTGGLVLSDADVQGTVKLTAAHVGTLVDGDTLSFWESGGHILDGFRYDRIIGFTDAAQRIKWLERQQSSHLTTNFAPQPWEQLIKVLREMGHPDAASEVAVAKQLAMRAAGKIGSRQPRAHLADPKTWFGLRKPLELGWIWLINMLIRGWHHVYGWLAGFGYRPGRLLVWMIGLWAMSALWYGHAADTGIMAPTDAQVTMHRQLHADLGPKSDHAGQCGVRHEVAPDTYWPACTSLPSEYTTFNPWVYSADLILPLVDLGQESEWGPAASFTDMTGTMHDLTEGMRTRALMWFQILFGWFASLMFVAIVSRLVDKD